MRIRKREEALHEGRYRVSAYFLITLQQETERTQRTHTHYCVVADS
jgi:hypothetical protein